MSFRVLSFLTPVPLSTRGEGEPVGHIRCPNRPVIYAGSYGV